MRYSKPPYYIDDDTELVDINVVAELLATSYWASDRSMEVIEASIKRSECFSLYNHKQQIGFARVVSDYSTVAYIADVIIAPQYRGIGLGEWLIETITTDERWKSDMLLLVTDDAHKLYKKFGFKQSPKIMGKG